MTSIEEPKFGRDVAEQAFEQFCVEMDIDHDVSKMDEKDAEGFNENKELIISAFMDGRLQFNENQEPELTCQRSKIDKPLVFREPSAADYMAMDRKKEGQDVGKMISLMDSVTRTANGTCSKLKGRDFKIAKAIMTLFMA